MVRDVLVAFAHLAVEDVVELFLDVGDAGVGELVGIARVVDRDLADGADRLHLRGIRAHARPGAARDHAAVVGRGDRTAGRDHGLVAGLDDRVLGRGRGLHHGRHGSDRLRPLLRRKLAVGGPEPRRHARRFAAARDHAARRLRRARGQEAEAREHEATARDLRVGDRTRDEFGISVGVAVVVGHVVLRCSVPALDSCSQSAGEDRQNARLRRKTPSAQARSWCRSVDTLGCKFRPGQSVSASGHSRWV